MRHKLDAQIASSLEAMQIDQPLVQVPRGDWRKLRESADAVYAGASAANPVPNNVTISLRETVAADGRRVSMRWYERSGSFPGSAVVYVHGGGLISGSAENYDWVVARYVSCTGVPMLSVDYALAPEYPYPVPLEDCLAALLWLFDNASCLGIDPSRIAVMGDSAGGGLAAALGVAAREKRIDLARQILIYPMLDDRRTEDDPAIAPFASWTADNNWTGWHALLGDQIGSSSVPSLAAPARLDDFAGLASAYVEVGDLDIFRDESIAFALNLARAGVPLELHVHSGAPHGFEYLSPDADITTRAMADRCRVICQL